MFGFYARVRNSVDKPSFLQFFRECCNIQIIQESSGVFYICQRGNGRWPWKVAVHPGFYSLYFPKGEPSNIRTDGVHMASNECQLNTICLTSQSLSFPNQSTRRGCTCSCECTTVVGKVYIYKWCNPKQIVRPHVAFLENIMAHWYLKIKFALDSLRHTVGTHSFDHVISSHSLVSNWLCIVLYNYKGAWKKLKSNYSHLKLCYGILIIQIKLD